MSSLLEKYYYSITKLTDPVYEELSPKELHDLRHSEGFKNYRVNPAKQTLQDRYKRFYIRSMWADYLGYKLYRLKRFFRFDWITLAIEFERIMKKLKK